MFVLGGWRDWLCESQSVACPELPDVLRLQEAGSWSSLQMPRRHEEEAESANEGMA